MIDAEMLLNDFEVTLHILKYILKVYLSNYLICSDFNIFYYLNYF